MPATIYSAYKKTKKVFLPLMLSLNIVSGFLVFLNIYFLTGATEYRDYMNEQYSNYM